MRFNPLTGKISYGPEPGVSRPTPRFDQVSGTVDYSSRQNSGGVVPSLDLNFALGSFAASRGPLPTFSRASAATYFGADGLLATASTNTPRLDYDPVTLACRGLLLEPAATNIVVYSELFSDASWSKGGVSLTGGQSSIDGGSNAFKLTASAGESAHWIFCSPGSFANNFASVYAKADTSNFLGIGFGVGALSASVYGGALFNLSDGTFVVYGTGATAEMVAVGGGWYRCCVHTPNSQNYMSMNVYGATPVDGNWTAAGTESVYIFGASVSGINSSYIPTAGSSVTRAADVCSISGSNFSGFYNQSAGSFVVDAEKIGGQSGVFIASDTTYDGNNRIDMRFPNVALVTNATVNVAALNYGTGRRKYLAYAANDFASGSDGGAGDSDASGSPPATLTKLVLACLEGGGNQSAMLLRRFRYFRSRLTEEQLLALTTP